VSNPLSVPSVEAPRPRRPFRLAGRLVSPDLNRVTTSEGDVTLEPKVMDVLLRLSAAPGSVVAKEDLLQDVWPGVHVTDDVLVRAVGEIRRVFEDDGAPVVETIRKRGYRLVAPVVYEFAADAGAPAPQRRRHPLIVAWIALAVLLAVALVMLRRPPPPPEPTFAPLTTLQGNEFDPALSPDGTRLAFAWDGGAEGPTDIYVKVVGEEATLRLTHDEETPRAADRAPAWSPDGSKVAFLRVLEERCDILVVSAVGGPVRRIAPCTNRDHPRFSWSPDAKSLAVTQRLRPDAPASTIHLLNVDSAEVHALATEPAGDAIVDTSPAFSPDGQSVAFIREYSDSVGDIYKVPAQGGPATRLTSDNADIMGFTWSGNDRLVLSSNRAGMYSLWGVSTAGGAPTLVAGGGRKIKHPSATRSGRIAYEAWNYDMNLWRQPVGGLVAPGLPIAVASDEWSYEPRWSPDGERIAFVSTRSGGYELWVSDANGSQVRRVTSFKGGFVGSPRWSPDGRRLVFVARPKGPAQVHVVDVEGGPAQAVAQAPLDAVAPAFSNDGKSILFGSSHEGAWQVYRLPLDSGPPRRLTANGGYAALESPDGQWLYFSKIDRAGLWRLPLGGGDEQLLTKELQPEDWGAWGVNAKGVYWLGPRVGDSPPSLEMLMSGESTPRALGLVQELAWRGIDLAPDGSELIYSRLGRHDSNLALLEFK